MKVSIIIIITVYADLPSFLSPCLITGESLRPDFLLLTENQSLYILELTLGFETNIQINSNRKAVQYNSLLSQWRRNRGGRGGALAHPTFLPCSIK